MAKNPARKHTEPKTDRTPQILTGIWAVLMLSLFPLIFTDFYFNILETKFITLCILNFGVMGGILLWRLFSAPKPAEPEAKGSALSGLSATDWCMLAYLACATVATANASPYIWQAFSGIEGRYTGLFYILMLTGTWFTVTRHYSFETRVITVFFCAAWIVSLLGISDFYDMNLLHFKDEMREDEYQIFTSTIGNINTYVVLIGIFTAIASSLFVLSEEGSGRILFYYLSVVVSFLAIATGSSDNGYLSLGALFAFLPLAAFRNQRALRRYVVLLATYLSVILFLLRESRLKAGKVIRIDGFFNLFRKVPALPKIALLLWALAAALYLLAAFRRKKSAAPAKNPAPAKNSDPAKDTAPAKAAAAPKDPEALPVAVRIVWGILVAGAACVLLSVLVKANRMSMQEAGAAYGNLAQYLKFSDSWGTNRGYIWRVGWEEYMALPLSKRITGSGPDTFGIYMMIHRWKEMQEKTNQIFDSAHNEYLQYLFTVGPVGLLSYLGVLATSVYTAFRTAVRMYRRGGERDILLAPYLCAFAFMVLCYACQAVVNINIPIATPVLWTFLMIAAAMARNERK